MNEAFLRQRRNVFIVCAILWALCLGGVDLQELTFAGMKFSAFKRPEVFLYGIWIAFGYFAYRLVVYFMEGSADQISRLYLREMERSVAPRLRSLIHKEFPKTSTPVAYEHFRKNKRTYRGQREELRTEHGREFTQIINFELPVPGHKTALWEFRGFLRFAFLTPALTDHVLPLLLSAGTLIYCGFVADWRGNLLGVF